jgi:hypothetical protein
MKLSKLSFDELMTQLKKPAKQKNKDKEVQYVMELVRLMAKSKAQMDFLNREFNKHFFVNKQLESFFKRSYEGLDAKTASGASPTASAKR